MSILMPKICHTIAKILNNRRTTIINFAIGYSRNLSITETVTD